MDELTTALQPNYVSQVTFKYGEPITILYSTDQSKALNFANIMDAVCLQKLIGSNHKGVVNSDSHFHNLILI